MKPHRKRPIRWYQSLTLRLLLLFWALLFLTASSGYLLAVWNKVTPEVKPIAEPIRRTLAPLLENELTYLSLQPGRLLTGDYRVAARVLAQGQQKLMMDEFLSQRYRQTMLRFLNYDEPMQMPLEDRLLIGPFEFKGNKLLITRPLKASEWTDREEAEQELMRARSWTLVGGSLAIAILLGIWLIRPIKRMIRATREVAQGSAEPDLGQLPRRKDEVGELARALAQTARDLAISRDAQRRLLSDVSHELRSPMARMQVALDLSEDEHQEDAHWQQLRRDSERLNQIIERILSLSKLENGLISLNTHTVDLRKLVQRLVDDTLYSHPEYKDRLVIREGDWRELESDDELIRLVLENIMRNALHYTDKAVEFGCEKHGKWLQLYVRDHGPGVDEETIEKLFEPFYRGDPSRKHQAGVGLGLALSQRSALVLGGQLRARNHPQGGLEVILDLPLD